MAHSGGRNERIVDIAMILADGWLRLADTHAAENVVVALRKSSISLAISSNRRQVSGPTLNSVNLSPERGSNV